MLLLLIYVLVVHMMLYLNQFSKKHNQDIELEFINVMAKD